MHFFKKYLYRCNVQIIGTSGNPARATLATLGMEVHTLSALAACQKLVLTNMDGSWENGDELVLFQFVPVYLYLLRLSNQLIRDNCDFYNKISFQKTVKPQTRTRIRRPGGARLDQQELLRGVGVRLGLNIY